MSIDHRVKLSAFSVLLLASVSRVYGIQTVVQPKSLEVSNTGDLYQGSGVENLAGGGFFTAPFAPFDSSLGTLVSFTLNCEIQGELDGMVSPDATNGEASGSVGGTFMLGGIAFDGTGGSNKATEAGGAPLLLSFGIPSYEKIFEVADAGVKYNPALRDLVAGDQPFEFSYDSGVSVGFASMVDLKAGVAATLTLTYTYGPPSGGLASLRIVKIIRNSEAGEVEIEWTSSPGKSYRLEAGSGLTEAEFALVNASIPGGAGPTTTFVEGMIGPSIRKRFYRVLENE
ncbi:hypothetical protein V2O64_15450 [Verrucomicrobiaceae bacterium 227]